MKKSVTAAGALTSIQTHRAAVCNVVLAGMASAFHVGKATISLTELQHDFGGTLASLGLIISAFPLVGVLGGVAAGFAVQRWGDRSMLIAGLMILAAASTAGACSTEVAWLLFTRLVEGLGFLIVVVAAPAVLHRVTPGRRRGLVFGFWSAYMPVGIALALLMGPYLGGWRHVWLASAVLVTLAALGLFVTTPRGDIAPHETSLRRMLTGLRELFASRSAVMLSLSFTIYGAQFFAVMGFLPIFLMQRADVSLRAAGSLSAAIVSVNVIGSSGAGWLLSHGRSAGSLITKAFVAMGCSAAVLFYPATPAPLVIALCFVFSAIAGMVPATCIATAPAVVESASLAPISIGLVMQGSYLGQVIGPLSAGVIVGALGWSGEIALTLVTTIVGATLGTLLPRSNPSRQ